MHWTIQLDGGPRRVNHAAVVLGDKIYSFGGFCSMDNFEIRKPIDVNILDTCTFRWKTLPVPDYEDDQFVVTPYQRYGHTAVAYNGKAYIWGGRNDCDGASALLHEFDPETKIWSIVPTPGMVPSARDGHSACVVGDRMIIFGGFEEEFQRFSQESFAFDFKTKRWSEIKSWGVAPAWRDFHTATTIGNRMYIFGGRSDQLGQFHSNREIYFDKLKYLDLTDNSWHEPETYGDKPTGRRSHSAWQYNGKLYVFGGYSGATSEHFNDLHQFDPVTSVWTKVSPHGNCPVPRRRQCCVMKGDKMYLFGGTAPIDSVEMQQRICGNSSGDGEIALLPMVGDILAERNLVDLADLYVLDYAPSLRTLTTVSAIRNKLFDTPLFSILPWDVRLDVIAMSKSNRITVPRFDASG